MIRNKCIYIVVLMTITTIMVYAQQYNAESDFNVTRTADGNSVVITGYTGTSQIVNIPPQIRQLPVTSIGNEAFRSKGLIEVTIPDGVIRIGNRAFESNSLTNINIPSSVTHLGNYAFSSNRLEIVILTSGIVEIGSYAFEMNRLTSLIIPDTVTNIGIYAFANNSSLETLVLPNNIKIDQGAFNNYSLKKITIGNNANLSSFVTSFVNGFDQFYRAGGRRAGTYVYNNGSWSEEW